jgi:endoglucanase
MLDPSTPDRDSILKAMTGMGRYLHTNSSPSCGVRADGTIENANSPVGFSAALLPNLSALNDKNLEDQQMSRLLSEFHPESGLYGNPAK